MWDATRVRAVIVIAAVAMTAVVPGALALAPRSTTASGTCSWRFVYPGRSYCVGTLTVSHWCPAYSPCPNFRVTTTVLNYSFSAFGFVFRNGTTALEIVVTDPNGTQFSFTLWGVPLGGGASWTAPDGGLLVVWSNAPFAGISPESWTSTVTCGVAAP